MAIEHKVGFFPEGQLYVVTVKFCQPVEWMVRYSDSQIFASELIERVMDLRLADKERSSIVYFIRFSPVGLSCTHP